MWLMHFAREQVCSNSLVIDRSCGPSCVAVRHRHESRGSEWDCGLYEQAVAVAAREGKASTSFIQRHLNIGYNRAAKLIEQMEKEGVVGPANHVGKREVLIRRMAEED
jgi:DNA segregation ATPase FtsK/SpoIIIE-like protein